MSSTTSRIDTPMDRYRSTSWHAERSYGQLALSVAMSRTLMVAPSTVLVSVQGIKLLSKFDEAPRMRVNENEGPK